LYTTDKIHTQYIYFMENKKKADSAEEARKNETPAGEHTLTQDTGPKAQGEQLRGDDTVDNEVSDLDSEETKESDAEYKGKSPDED
jgi:hypothetical protein